MDPNTLSLFVFPLAALVVGLGTIWFAKRATHRP